MAAGKRFDPAVGRTIQDSPGRCCRTAAAAVAAAGIAQQSKSFDRSLSQGIRYRLDIGHKRGFPGYCRTASAGHRMASRMGQCQNLVQTMVSGSLAVAQNRTRCRLQIDRSSALKRRKTSTAILLRPPCVKRILNPCPESQMAQKSDLAGNTAGCILLEDRTSEKARSSPSEPLHLGLVTGRRTRNHSGSAVILGLQAFGRMTPFVASSHPVPRTVHTLLSLLDLSHTGLQIESHSWSEKVRPVLSSAMDTAGSFASCSNHSCFALPCAIAIERLDQQRSLTGESTLRDLDTPSARGLHLSARFESRRILDHTGKDVGQHICDEAYCPVCAALKVR